MGASMKVVALSFSALMMTFLLGCTEQSQMTGPAAGSSLPSQAISKTSDVLSIETTVVGPGGVKYHVVGMVDCNLSGEEQIYRLATNVDLNVSENGTEKAWGVSGGSQFKAEVGEEGVCRVSESRTFSSLTRAYANYCVVIDYIIAEKEVRIDGVHIINTASSKSNS